MRVWLSASVSPEKKEEDEKTMRAREKRRKEERRRWRKRGQEEGVRQSKYQLVLGQLLPVSLTRLGLGWDTAYLQ